MNPAGGAPGGRRRIFPDSSIGPGTSKEPQVSWLSFDLFLSAFEVYVVLVVL